MRYTYQGNVNNKQLEACAVRRRFSTLFYRRGLPNNKLIRADVSNVLTVARHHSRRLLLAPWHTLHGTHYFTNMKEKIMPLIRLIYSSIKANDVESSEIERILEVAKVSNKKQNITGMLCFNRNYFLQVLEGERSKVCELYAKIANDKRHTHLVIYHLVEVNQREFHDWSMGYVPESSLTAHEILKHASSTEFNPTEMSAQSILQMMLSLRQKVSVI